MSIENHIKCLEESIDRLTAAISSVKVGGETPIKTTSDTVKNTQTVAPFPVLEDLPATQGDLPDVPDDLPSTPGPELAFNSTAELVKYTMDSYNTLGPEKGGEIQQALTALGYSNINDIKPEHFNEFHASIEKILAGG